MVSPAAVSSIGPVSAVAPSELASTGSSTVEPLAGATAAHRSTSSPVSASMVKALSGPSTAPSRTSPVSADEGDVVDHAVPGRVDQHVDLSAGVGRGAGGLGCGEDQQPVVGRAAGHVGGQRLYAEVGQVSHLRVRGIARRIGEQPGIDLGGAGVYAAVADPDGGEPPPGAGSTVAEAVTSERGTGTNRKAIRSGSTPVRSCRGPGHDQAVQRNQFTAVAGRRTGQPGHVAATELDRYGDGASLAGADLDRPR